MRAKPLINKIKILIIDDDHTTRRTINRILSKSNQAFSFEEAESGAEGLAMISENSYDCIIVDYLLGDMNGLDLLVKLAETGMPVPTIMLTSHGDEMLAVKSIKAGAYDYLSKTILSRPDFSDIITRSIFDAVQQFTQDHEKKRARIALEMSEERYRGLIENSDILIIRFFVEDRIINFVNDGFCRYFNVQRFEILGESFLDFIPKDERERINQIINSLTREHSHGHYELFTQTSRGERWQIWTFHAIFDHQERIIEFQCMGEDITDLKQTQFKLSDMLTKVQEMKKSQDGDYFLTSLLLDQLNGNFAKSDSFEIKALTIQKKRFSFRKWIKEIGGDLCYTQNINLRGIPYIIFLNADAMGKSIQGAGGALVLGAVVHSIINRIKFSSFEQNQPPEQFIRNTYYELQRVFEGFNGTMMVSLVFGVIDENNGMIYYINAEHPWSVLYRKGSSTFLEDQLLIRKLGVDLDYSPLFKIKTFKMTKDDIIIIGSDGRDDFLIMDGKGNSSLNEDEKFFLSLVEESNGDIDKIHQLILSMGELTDDLSLLSIAYVNSPDRDDELFPEQITACLKSIREHESSGNTEKAIDRCGEALAQYKSSTRLLKKKNSLLVNTKQYEAALPGLESYHELNPEDTKTLYLLSYVLWKNRMMKKAAESAERLMLREPENVTYLLHFARVSLSMKNFIEADKILDRIFKLDPDNKRANKLKKLL